MSKTQEMSDEMLAEAFNQMVAEGEGMPWRLYQKEPTCECGNPSNPEGQGHSTWCDLFKSEF